MSPRVRQTWDRIDDAVRDAVGAARRDRTGQVVKLGRWDHLVPDAVSQDPAWPWIVARLADAQTRGADVEAALAGAVAVDRPLPDEHPAAALWWRVAPGVDRPRIDIPDAVAARLRPAWADSLLDRIPTETRHVVVDSPAWPRLVAAAETIDPETRDAVLALAVDAALARTAPDDALAAVIAGHILSFGRPPDDADDHGPEPDHSPEDDAFLTHVLAQKDTPSRAKATVRTIPDPADGPDPEPPPADVHVVEPDEGPESERPAATPKNRIIELNRASADWWRALYVGSTAAKYLAGRLGTDLADDDRWTVGRAPAGWTGLVDRLTAAGATPEELVDAGLGKWARGGRLIDVFRDRLVIGIRDADGELVGFTGRAAPGGDPKTPKYLNTPATVAFNKGQLLFGAELMAADSTPVVVEGPLDAIAVTLASNGRAVGLSPGGTALTAAQLDLVAAHIAEGPVLVATDDDDAGWKAARRAYDLITGLGGDPRRLQLAGKDPAEHFRRDPASLALKLAHPDLNLGLGSQLVFRRATQAAGRLAENIMLRHLAAQEAGQLLAALPLPRWDEEIRLAADAIAYASGDEDARDALATTVWRNAIETSLGVADATDGPEDPDAASRRDLAERIEELRHGFDPFDPYSAGVDPAADEAIHHILGAHGYDPYDEMGPTGGRDPGLDLW
jgi:hypothetical protein